MDTLAGETCPVCLKKTLTLTEDEKDIPYFGKIFLFSMHCSDKECNFKQNDIEAAEPKEPCKITFTTENEKDLSVRVVKSSAATIIIPQLKLEINPGAVADGYVSNIEGILQRFEEILKEQKNNDEDEAAQTTAKNLLKKIWKVKLGDIPLKIIIEDPTGNSAIISPKAVLEKMKTKR
ncbi:MAG: ZPR1 zinc finger domain-containing protein [Nanoarchaeota archaeon]|nr:ZPR1 zinc finger domain-containing protein [Nanoarchaeota archaeon]